MQLLKVSENRRFLVREDGTPFFYLGDTAWELFHRLDGNETEDYLRDRAEKKFTAIHAVVLAEHEFGKPGPNGNLPLIDNDPDRPNEAYFSHVDWVVSKANELGLVVGMLPAWGDKWNRAWGAGPEIFTPENARSFGRFLGRRYVGADLIWILGGDRPVETEGHREIIRSMALGLGEGDGGVHLKTFHPPGVHSSSEYFPGDPWLDFHMWQSGHSRNTTNYRFVASDYARRPVKPVIDGEAGYEDHPANFDARNGYLNEADVRKNAYWAVFAGAFGHTYGCHDIWQFLDRSRFVPVASPLTPWREALRIPGAAQMQHLRALMESRPMLTRIPDQSLLVSDLDDGGDHVQATRAADGSYAFVYSASGQPFAVRDGRLAGSQADAHWFDPRTGRWQEIGLIALEETTLFTPPSQGLGHDWVLVLDPVPSGR